MIARVREAAGEPEGALVLLHGRGTDENDLHPLLDMLDPGRRLTGLTPRAPFSMPPGGYHWYGPVRRVGYPDRDTFSESLALIGDWLGTLGVPLDRTVLGGFSQGAVMSYAMALGEGRERPAGLIALSGFLPRVDGFALDPPAGFRAALGHGTHDPVIPAGFGREAREALETAGCEVTWRESPMAHTIDPAYLGELRAWLEETLP
ncbi:MAG TPA: hypothetical protein VNT32_05580 [Thermoleophilaceae bacterium]|nr:hypothetical protein [Thermoleophilaceae bacterium]